MRIQGWLTSIYRRTELPWYYVELRFLNKIERENDVGKVCFLLSKNMEGMSFAGYQVGQLIRHTPFLVVLSKLDQNL